MNIKGVVADTHAIIWYLDSPSELSLNAVTALDNAANDDGQRIFISAISLIEMKYLTEKGRIKQPILPRILAEIDDPRPIIEVIPVDRIVADSLASIPRDLVSDMPDRIIAASALIFNLPLVSIDAKIHTLSSITTIW